MPLTLTGTIYSATDKELGVRQAVWFAKETYNAIKPSVERPFKLYEVPGSVNSWTADSWMAARLGTKRQA